MIIPLIPHYFHHYIKYIVRVIITRKVQRREKLLQNPMRKIWRRKPWMDSDESSGRREGIWDEGHGVNQRVSPLALLPLAPSGLTSDTFHSALILPHASRPRSQVGGLKWAVPCHLSSTSDSLCLKVFSLFAIEQTLICPSRLTNGFLLLECLSHLKCSALPREEKVQPFNSIGVLITPAPPNTHTHLTVSILRARILLFLSGFLASIFAT